MTRTLVGTPDPEPLPNVTTPRYVTVTPNNGWATAAPSSVTANTTHASLTQVTVAPTWCAGP